MFKNFLKKKERKDPNNKNVLIIALLIHAAKIDENYTEIEKKIIKKALIDLNNISSDQAEELIKRAEKKEEEKFNKVEHAIKKIRDKHLIEGKKSIDTQQFVLEMESFYADLLRDETTTALMQGYDYIAFVEWNQKTKKLNNEEDKLSASDSIQKKFLRDRIFITRLSKTIVFLSNGFRNLENRLF